MTLMVRLQRVVVSSLILSVIALATSAAGALANGGGGVYP
jgi:hypothetical protein